jgi:hypothetical protein
MVVPPPEAITGFVPVSRGLLDGLESAKLGWRPLSFGARSATTLRQLGRRNEEDFYPKVKENAWTPESRNSIVNVLSATLPFCLMS